MFDEYDVGGIIVHTLFRGKHLDIYWNNFVEGYRKYGVRVFTKHAFALVIHFGRGEFVIAWRK